MAIRSQARFRWCRLLAGWLLIAPIPIVAAEVWTGPIVAFSKSGADSPTDPANQDAMTANVVITRNFAGGIINIAQENTFSQTVSPADTEWAFAGLNGNPTGAGFSATLCAVTPSPCSFDNWFDAQGENSMGQFLVGRPAVVHLITDDIYADVTFTEWTNANAGSRVTYERSSPGSVPIPLPLWAMLLAAGMLALLGRRRLDNAGHPRPWLLPMGQTAGIDGER